MGKLFLLGGTHTGALAAMLRKAKELDVKHGVALVCVQEIGNDEYSLKTLSLGSPLSVATTLNDVTKNVNYLGVVTSMLAEMRTTGLDSGSVDKANLAIGELGQKGGLTKLVNVFGVEVVSNQPGKNYRVFAAFAGLTGDEESLTIAEAGMKVLLQKK